MLDATKWMKENVRCEVRSYENKVTSEEAFEDLAKNVWVRINHGSGDKWITEKTILTFGRRGWGGKGRLGSRNAGSWGH